MGYTSANRRRASFEAPAPRCVNVTAKPACSPSELDSDKAARHRHSRQAVSHRRSDPHLHGACFAGKCPAAAMYTQSGTAKLNGLDPQAWLADMLARIADHNVHDLHELLPWD
ncbi:IS66 C-terminal element [Rhizobiales bacterium GAS191]|nr:IS66 C-terminal element [Rhizobiales bacterium GAS191]